MSFLLYTKVNLDFETFTQIQRLMNLLYVVITSMVIYFGVSFLAGIRGQGLSLMYLIRGIGNLEAFKRKFSNQTMSGTIGNFDGLHKGHQAILNQVKAKAVKSSSASLVFFY